MNKIIYTYMIGLFLTKQKIPKPIKWYIRTHIPTKISPVTSVAFSMIRNSADIDNDESLFNLIKSIL